MSAKNLMRRPGVLLILLAVFAAVMGVNLYFDNFTYMTGNAVYEIPEEWRGFAEAVESGDWGLAPQPPLEESFDLENPTIPIDEIERGGPPKDGIPAITDPHTVSVASVDFLEPGDRIAGVVINGEARAYPVRLLNWHEVVNDELSGTPFAMIYCPLCDSVSVVGREVEGEVLEFGISGLLYNSNVLMYDRTHDALWSQIAFEAVTGPYSGTPLKHLPWEITTFGDWRDAHPDSTVATFDTGHERNYDRNPYADYFESDELMFAVKGDGDPRLGRKDLVVGVEVNGFTRAYPVDAVANAPGGRLEEDTDAGRIVLEAADGGEGVRVAETPPDARTVHTFWFAWVAFHPETTLYGEAPADNNGE